jgi:predicted ATPase
LTSLIGREAEVAEIKAALASHRLVTLTGSGGVGKTRLVIEVGRSVLDRYPDGVWLAELAPLTDSQLVTFTIGAVLGVSLSSAATATEALASALHTKQFLLIIDNCEHVIAEVARVAEALIQACAHLSIVASSRERLAIAGESVIRVPSLPTPQASAGLTAMAACEYPAVRLFVERASALGLGFALTDANAATIGSICTRLDGIPLAIELAVPRLRVLSVEQLARGLEERFRLLTGGNRTALPRQQTLHALIDWSYALLNDPEKLLLARLAVFSGSALLTSITAVVVSVEIPPEQCGETSFIRWLRSPWCMSIQSPERPATACSNQRGIMQPKSLALHRRYGGGTPPTSSPGSQRRRQSGKRPRRSDGSYNMKPTSTICAVHWNGLSGRTAMLTSRSISWAAATLYGPNSG